MEKHQKIYQVGTEKYIYLYSKNYNFTGRLVAATWWLFGFIIIASYTANLAAFLTVSRLDTPVESLDDLSKQYKISYAPINGSAAMTYFERMAAIEQRFYEYFLKFLLHLKLF